MTKYVCLLLIASLLSVPRLAVAETAEWAPGLPVGTPFPRIDALDHLGQARNFESLTGKSGLLYLFNRSSDW